MSNSGIISLTDGERSDYPLVGARVHYCVIDIQLLGNLTQTYVSNASLDAEICYVFPLPPDASVCSFKAVLDGTRTIKGIVKGNQTAKAEYKKAVSQGRTAALLQQHNVEIFQVALGNIRPKQTIEVHISFVSVISHDGSVDSLRLMFPTAIAPRYGTPPSEIEGMDTRTNPLELTVAVEMTSLVKSITSPTHPMAVTFGTSSAKTLNAELDPRKAHVKFSSSTFLEKDIVLVLSCEGLDRPRCTVETLSSDGCQEDTDAYALTVVPRFDLPALPRQEYIFLVDRSGSMDGRRIADVRKALQIMLRSLPSRDTTFNIISFGSRTASLWPSSVTYSSNTVAQASTYVDRMAADFGGTEMRAALQATFACRNKAAGEAVPTAVFLLTDGDVWDLDGVKKVIQDECTKARAENGLLRVFCLGIGDAISKAMCDGIARTGQGTAVFVGENESPNQKLMGLLKAARGGVMEDLSIDWGIGDTQQKPDEDFEMVSSPAKLPSKPEKAHLPIQMLDDTNAPSSDCPGPELGPHHITVILPPPPHIQQAPSVASLPPFYPGVRTSVFAIIKRTEMGILAPSQTVRIKGTVLGHPIVLQVPVVPVHPVQHETRDSENRKVLHILAARALILSFEDRLSGAGSEDDKAQIVRLATRYGLASSQTSFVAVDEEVQETAGLVSSAGNNVLNIDAVQGRGVQRMGLHGRGGLGVGRGGLGVGRGGLGVGRGGLGVGGAMRRGTNLRSPRPASVCSSLTMSSQSNSDNDVGMGGGPAMATYFPVAQTLNSECDSDDSEDDWDMGFGLFDGAEPVAQAATDRAPGWSPPTIDTIARAQEFDGSFLDCSVLFEKTMPAILLTPPEMLQCDDGVKIILWCTALCVSWLERYFKDEEDVWFMLAEKARMYIKDTGREVFRIQELDVEAFVQRLMTEAKRRLDALSAE